MLALRASPRRRKNWATSSKFSSGSGGRWSSTPTSNRTETISLLCSIVTKAGEKPCPTTERELTWLQRLVTLEKAPQATRIDRGGRRSSICDGQGADRGVEQATNGNLCLDVRIKDKFPVQNCFPCFLFRNSLFRCAGNFVEKRPNSRLITGVPNASGVGFR